MDKNSKIKHKKLKKLKFQDKNDNLEEALGESKDNL